MFLIKPHIFNQFPEITCAFSTKIGLQREKPFYFNISFSVGDDENLVKLNRSELFSHLNLESYKIHFQKQTHSDIIREVNHNSIPEESDAMICCERQSGLAIIAADCVSIFIYDPKNQVIAAVHSGWRGTYKRILEKTLILMSEKYFSNSKDLYVYLGPSISQPNYPVGKEVADLFDKKYIINCDEYFLLDVAEANYDMLINFGVKKNQIQRSLLCTFEISELFHSYRRDGIKSGRSLGVIALR